ncbi:MAG TPA: MFS transporter [Longimicrobium sp.]|nr:MFS transporter [Longimicrobium sp.]
MSRTVTAPLSAPTTAPADRAAPATAATRSPLGLIFLSVFLDALAFATVFPMLPLYAQGFGAGPEAVTALVAVYSLMQFALAPWWGRLSDRVGRRPVLLAGTLGAALSFLGFGIAGSLAVLFVARALNGAVGASVGVAQAYIADVTTPERRARGMGLVGAAFALAFVVGPALGGALTRLGPAAPFYAGAGIALANLLLQLTVLPESLPPAERRAPPGAGIRAGLRALRDADAGLKALYATLFLGTAGLAAMEATLALWARARWELTQEMVGYGFAMMGAVAAIAQGGLVGVLVRRLGERRTALLGFALIVASMLALAAAPTLALAAAALAAFAFGRGTMLPPVAAMMSHHGGGALGQGRIFGASASVSSLARVLGALASGVLYARLGMEAPYLATAVLALGAAALLLPGPRWRAAP